MIEAERLAALESRLDEACRVSGRSRDQVSLVAVSKRHPAEAIDRFLALGVRDFGENYVQEALEKFPRPSARLHFIGALQRNKIRKVLPLTHLVHGVASLSVLQAIDRIAQEESLPTPEFLLQVHLTDEPTKQGFSIEEIPAALDACATLAHSRVRGFMAMAPLEGGSQAARATFARARELLERSKARLGGLEFLSMGMSHDLAEAVAEGATHVRIGTALFGERTVS